MRQTLSRLLTAAFCLAMTQLAPSALHAADARLTFVIGAAPGSGYDRYGRLMAEYLGRALGESVVVENYDNPDAATALAEIASGGTDGSRIMLVNTGMLLTQIATPDQAKYDFATLGVIGKASSEARILSIRAAADVPDLAALMARTKPLLMATGSFGSTGFIQTRLFAKEFALPVRVIPGFNGNELAAALAKDEVDLAFDSESSADKLISQGVVRALAVIGSPSVDSLRGLPSFDSLVTTPAQELLVGQMTRMTQLGRLTVAPPATDPARLEALRAAFASVMTDPEFLAAAAEQKLQIDYATGEATAQLIRDFMDSATPEFRAMLAEALAR